jgi:hypothetical protein
MEIKNNIKKEISRKESKEKEEASWFEADH